MKELETRWMREKKRGGPRLLAQLKKFDKEATLSVFASCEDPIHKPCKVSFALQDAEPTPFVATQVYSPECLISPRLISSTAVLSSYSMEKSAPCVRGLPSFCHDTSMGDEPATRHSKRIGWPSVSWTLVIFLGKDGGVLASADDSMTDVSQFSFPILQVALLALNRHRHKTMRPLYTLL